MDGPSNKYYSRAYIKSLENELAIHRQKAQRYREAIASLESERQANELLTARIEELEAQVPKAMKPKHNIGNYDCPDCKYCGTLPEPCLYCPGCGAKLDWEDK